MMAGVNPDQIPSIQWQLLGKLAAMKAAQLKILSYGLLLAMLVLAAEWLEFQFFLKRYRGELYLLIGGAVFTGLGIFIGAQLTRPRRVAVASANQAALQVLGVSEREQAVLELLIQGASNQEIADQLFISPNTVKTHLKHLYQKLEVKRRGQAVEKALQLQLIATKTTAKP
jgi:DNA-binding CsgD family transcriptional regulator